MSSIFGLKDVYLLQQQHSTTTLAATSGGSVDNMQRPAGPEKDRRTRRLEYLPPEVVMCVWVFNIAILVPTSNNITISPVWQDVWRYYNIAEACRGSNNE
jgi:hypothetical protein